MATWKKYKEVLVVKIFYDSNNFIVQTVSFDTCVCLARRAVCDLDHQDLDIIATDYPGLTCVNVCDYNETENVLDEYGLPIFKWISNNVVRVLDPTDYQINPHFWSLYIIKLTDEVIDELTSNSDAEMKIIYDASPSYKKLIIYQQIEIQAAATVNQTAMNLTLEMPIRILSEYLYITQVEQRALTTEETAGFHLALTTIHNHSVGMNLPLNSTEWYQTFLTNMLSASDALRTATIGRRYYITGGF